MNGKARRRAAALRQAPNIMEIREGIRAELEQSIRGVAFPRSILVYEPLVTDPSPGTEPESEIRRRGIPHRRRDPGIDQRTMSRH